MRALVVAECAPLVARERAVGTSGARAALAESELARAQLSRLVAGDLPELMPRRCGGVTTIVYSVAPNVSDAKATNITLRSEEGIFIGQSSFLEVKFVS